LKFQIPIFNLSFFPFALFVCMESISVWFRHGEIHAGNLGFLILLCALGDICGEFLEDFLLNDHLIFTFDLPE